MIRRSFGRQALWIASTLLAFAMSAYLLVSVRPRIAPQPEHPLAFAAVLLMAIAMVVAPAYGLDRGARRLPAPLLRQVGLGILAAVATLLAGFLVTYLG